MFYAKAMRIYTSNTIHCCALSLHTSPQKLNLPSNLQKKRFYPKKKNNKTCIGTGIEVLANSEVPKKTTITYI